MDLSTSLDQQDVSGAEPMLRTPFTSDLGISSNRSSIVSQVRGNCTFLIRFSKLFKLSNGGFVELNIKINMVSYNLKNLGIKILKVKI